MTTCARCSGSVIQLADDERRCIMCGQSPDEMVPIPVELVKPNPARMERKRAYDRERLAHKGGF